MSQDKNSKLCIAVDEVESETRKNNREHWEKTDKVVEEALKRTGNENGYIISEAEARINTYER